MIQDGEIKCFREINEQLLKMQRAYGTDVFLHCLINWLGYTIVANKGLEQHIFGTIEHWKKIVKDHPEVLDLLSDKMEAQT